MAAAAKQPVLAPLKAAPMLAAAGVGQGAVSRPTTAGGGVGGVGYPPTAMAAPMGAGGAAYKPNGAMAVASGSAAGALHNAHAAAGAGAGAHHHAAAAGGGSGAAAALANGNGPGGPAAAALMAGNGHSAPAAAAAAASGTTSEPPSPGPASSSASASAAGAGAGAGAAGAGLGAGGLGVSSLKQINDKIPNEVRELREHFAAIPSPGLGVKHFTLCATLGTGTFGRVRLVNYTHNHKTHWFALKMLKKTEIIRLKQVDHIKAEKAILCKITHPFIVNLYAHFQDEKNLYMLMEYVIGGELFSQLRKVGRFHNDVSRFYAAEIILALEYLHDRNIVYRDLKPENLLIDRDGHIKITDFGFAKLVEDRTWTLCGTPEYLAPEIIQSKGHGKAVDWWALGILIYEMLAGYPPFYDENPFGIYQKILAGKIEFPRHFDPNAKDLVKKLLQPDRSKRYGCLKNGAEDIKRHKWFKDVNWADCFKRALKPPFIPAYAAPNDTSNFDKYPDSDSEKDKGAAAAAAGAGAGKEKDLFADF